MSLIKSPFFIVGCPRSGTTLLQILLDSHPEICIPPESFFFTRFAACFETYGNLEKRKNLEHFVTDILKDERIKEWDLKISVSNFCDLVQNFSVQGVVSTLFQLYANKEGKSYWGDKTPQHMFYLREIKAIFPDAKFIHLVRDGRDVAESLSRVYLGPQSIYSIAKKWRDYVLTFVEFKKELSVHQFLEVNYENLVCDKAGQIQKIINFLNLDFSGFTEFSQDTIRKEKYFRMSQHHRSIAEPISGQKIGIFKRKLSSRKIEIFEAIAGDAMKVYGYPRLTSEVNRITVGEKIVFHFEDYLIKYVRKFNNWESFKLFVKQINLAGQLYIRKLSRLYLNQKL